MGQQNSGLTGAFGLFGKSYDLVRQNMRVFGWVYSLPIIVAVITGVQIFNDNQGNGWNWSHAFGSSIFGSGYGSSSSSAGSGAVLGFSVVALGIIASIISSVLATVLTLRVAQGKKPGFGDIWSEIISGWLWLKLLLVSLLSAVIIGIGFLLIIVPGIILIARLFLAPYILIDKKTTIIESLNQSWTMTKGYFSPIWAVLAVGFLLSLSGIIPVIGGLVSVLLGLAYSVSHPLRYLEIKAANKSA